MAADPTLIQRGIEPVDTPISLTYNEFVALADLGPIRSKIVFNVGTSSLEHLADCSGRAMQRLDGFTLFFPSIRRCFMRSNQILRSCI